MCIYLLLSRCPIATLYVLPSSLTPVLTCVWPGVRIVDGTVTDVQEATALSRHIDKVAVFSASWGPSDDGRHIEGPDILASMALRLGVRQVSFLNNMLKVHENINYCFVSDMLNLLTLPTEQVMLKIH